MYYLTYSPNCNKYSVQILATFEKYIDVYNYLIELIDNENINIDEFIVHNNLDNVNPIEINEDDDNDDGCIPYFNYKNKAFYFPNFKSSDYKSMGVEDICEYNCVYKPLIWILDAPDGIEGDLLVHLM